MEKEREFYIGEDGLEHCSVCKEPLVVLFPERLQHVVGLKSHPRWCACQRAEFEGEERERKEREHLHEVEKNTLVCFSERAMKAWNFTNDNGSNPCMSYAKQYVEHWDEVKKKNIGLLLWGDVGTGKSYMAACIANALLEQEKKVLMTNFSTICNQIFASTDKNAYIEAVCSYDLLILDDLGSERSSSYMMENVFQVIDRRVCSGKPMIITTNLTVKEMRETQNMDEKRIYDRVLQNCQPICVNGENQRREKSKQNRIELEQIFQE